MIFYKLKYFYLNCKGINNDLANKSNSNHTHSNYSLTSHTHSNYVTSSQVTSLVNTAINNGGINVSPFKSITTYHVQYNTTGIT